MRRAIVIGLMLAGLAVAGVHGPAPVQADPLALPPALRFDVTLRGLPVGVLRLATRRTADAYAATARLEPAGLARVLPSARFTATVQGRLRGDRLQPLRYAEDVNTGRRESRTEMVWEDGVPRILRQDPERSPEPWHLDPAAQGGALDPMSVMLTVLSDVPPDRACRLDIATFDGRRRGRVVLTAARDGGAAPADGLRHCVGVYRRVAGYSAEELAERRDYAFRLTYAPGPDGRLRVVALEGEGQLGTARLIRR